jgi:hypothetical protein
MTGVTVAFCSSLLAAAVQPNTVGSKAAWYNQSVSSLPFVVDSFVGCLILVLCCGGRCFLRPLTPVSWLTFLFFCVSKYSEQLKQRCAIEITCYTFLWCTVFLSHKTWRLYQEVVSSGRDCHMWSVSSSAPLVIWTWLEQLCLWPWTKPHLLSTPGWHWHDHPFIFRWCHSQYFVLLSPSYISVRRHIQVTALRRVSIDHVMPTEWSFAFMPEVKWLVCPITRNVLFWCNWFGDTNVMRHLMSIPNHLAHLWDRLVGHHTT